MEFSRRVILDTPNPVSIAQREARRAGRLKVNLADSNPTRWGLGPGAPYQPDPQGQPAAREVLARWLSERDWREVNPDNLYLLSSTSQGYAWLTKLLCDPGDRLAAPTPGYPLVETIAGLESVGVDFYPLTWLGGRWELEDFENSVNHVNAVVAINPNNPTGSYVHSEDRARLVEFCAAREVALIADEVFFDFDLPHAPTRPEDRRRLAGTSEVLTFALDGMSKNLSAPGLKIAWLEVSGPAAQVAAAKKRLNIIADAYLPFSDVLAQRLPEYLAAVPAATATTRQRCRDNLTQLKGLLHQEPSTTVSLLEPEGGWNVLLRFPAHVDEDALLTGLIRERGITAQPGYFFDMPFAGVVSVSLLLEPDTFAAAVRDLINAIAAQV